MVGLVLLSKFLTMFVEFGVQTSLTVHDRHWVGNWWLGFAIFGAICVFWSIWLLGFPKEFPLTKKRREGRQREEKAETSYTKLKDIPKATKLLFSHLPFVFITLGACMEQFYISCSVAFTAKIIHTQFSVPSGKAALLFGVIAVPSAFFGNILGRRKPYTQYLQFIKYINCLRNHTRCHRSARVLYISIKKVELTIRL